ncbi:cytochrome c oxidase assembly protein [Planococcus sp. CAU13]|uniref:cytochrome c oxidase assembly protein n=1 Tax=Planococcus sp. CAU13 TaxID=1541197 RepID=UPI00052FE99F|nr:cytochrome c oxidase assembly protein [Planococcus sp. CAU13]
MHEHHSVPDAGEFLPLFLFAVLLAVAPYFSAVFLSNKKQRKWPTYRIVFWCLGAVSIAAALIGPLADQAHADFRMHMAVHLLLGMLAPLLIAISRPMTLLLRTLNVSSARGVTALLKSGPFRLMSNPITAAFLNIGGLYVLYMTALFHSMHQSPLVYALVHLHIFLAGYLFTVSIVYFDVTPHRFSFLFRSIVLIIALAGHKILAKTLYASPPEGVPRSEAEAGSMLMYYGGDAIDAFLIFFLCLHWYKAAAKGEASFF